MGGESRAALSDLTLQTRIYRQFTRISEPALSHMFGIAPGMALDL